MKMEGAETLRDRGRSGKGQDEFKAENASLNLWPKVSQPKELNLNGNVWMKTLAENTGSARVLQTTRTSCWSSPGRARTNEQTTAGGNTRGRGVSNGRTRRRQSGAPGTPASNAAARTKLQADKLVMEFGAEGSARQMVATGNVRNGTRRRGRAVTNSDGAKTESRSCSRTNNTGVATATDTCSSFTISYSDVTNSGCGGSYVILRTWTAKDACTNIASCVQTIMVQDTNPPSITCRGMWTLNCPADTRTNNTGVATATDTCSSFTISYSDVTNSGCGASFTILRTWKAKDACTNIASCVQTITVQDTNPPSITCPGDVTLNCPADTRTNNTGVATATDTCSSFTISYSDVTNSGCGGSYVILRTWKAKDACTNIASCVQTIMVQDTNPPSITCPGM